jgi:hypothetical protein
MQARPSVRGSLVLLIRSTALIDDSDKLHPERRQEELQSFVGCLFDRSRGEELAGVAAGESGKAINLGPADPKLVRPGSHYLV